MLIGQAAQISATVPFCPGRSGPPDSISWLDHETAFAPARMRHDNAILIILTSPA